MRAPSVRPSPGILGDGAHERGSLPAAQLRTAASPQPTGSAASLLLMPSLTARRASSTSSLGYMRTSSPDPMVQLFVRTP